MGVKKNRYYEERFGTGLIALILQHPGGKMSYTTANGTVKKYAFDHDYSEYEEISEDEYINLGLELSLDAFLAQA